MSRRIRMALIGATIGAAYGIFNASQKYPAEWWTFAEGQARIFGYTVVWTLVGMAIGYGAEAVRRNSN